jgi:hypothetical protein
MLRDLAAVLEDLQRGMQDASRHTGSGVRIAQAELTMPVDMALVLKDGGCALLADVSRNGADAEWLDSPSRLTLSWSELPTEALP